MSNAEKIYELVKTMPETQISEVLDFAEFLQQKASAKAEENKLTEDRSVPSQLVSLPTLVGAQALEILQRNGFVGCLHEEDDLSVRYKEELDWKHKA
jgi:Protein of unknown function (DUF2281)